MGYNEVTGRQQQEKGGNPFFQRGKTAVTDK